MICILKIIDINVIEQLWVPNEKFTSNSFHFELELGIIMKHF